MGKKKEQAVLALLEHSTVRKAAQAVGVGEATLFRWLQIPEFQQAYREGKRQVVDHAISRLQQAAGEAVETLRRIMNDKTKPASPRVTAAKAVLDLAVRAVEIESLEARVQELEDTLKRKGGF